MSFASLGLLAVAIVLVLVTCTNVGVTFFDREPLRHRVLGGVVWTLGALVLALQILFHVNLLCPGVVWACLVLFAAISWVLRQRLQPSFSAGSLRCLLVGASPIDLVASMALGLAVLSAFLLPIWQWDSLGYHLPFVNFVLQDGGHRGLPSDVPYLSTYPRNVALLFTALRSVMLDDKLLDLGQLPLGCVGALATYGIARELGASARAARAAGLMWICTPAVFLQLPTNYIDVGVATFFLLAAYFLLRPATILSLASAGIAIGLFLGTKPSTPPAAALLGLLLLLRAHGARKLRWGVVGLVVAGALGLDAYVEQLIRHGNPVWPAVVHLGPFELPGTIDVSELLASGAGTEKVHGSLPSRVIRSWTSMTSTPVFDMRVGGLHAAFLLALVPALLSIRSRSGVWAWSLAGIALVTPDPAVARYVLAFPALIFALSAASLTRLVPPRSKRGVIGLTAALAASQVYYAAPGLTGEGPPLWAYFSLSSAERDRAVGAMGRPAEFIDARQSLEPGEIAVYDKALWLPYLMWRADLKNRVVRIADDASVAEVREVLEQQKVKWVLAGEQEPTRSAVMELSHKFRPLFECKESCTAFYAH
jgi:hypothetical protein